MKRIVLIKPTIGYMDHQREKPALPLELLTAATFVAQEYSVVLIDQRLTPDIEAEISPHFDSDTLLFALTVYTGPSINSALQVSRFIKQNSRTPVLWGGVHPSVLPEQTIANENIDFIIRGEGEFTLKSLIEELQKETPAFSEIKGLGYKENGKPVLNQPADLVDMATTPLFPDELVDMDKYYHYFSGHEYVYYQASRGCPRACKYCYNQVFNRGKFRFRPIELVIEDISCLANKYAFEGIYFIDDNLFCLPKDYIFRLAEVVNSFNLKWIVQGGDITSLDRFSAEEFQRLYNMGLRKLSVGIESGSPRIRELVKKAGDIEMIRSVVKKMGTAPIVLWCSYMNNIHTETVEDLKASIELMFELQKYNKYLRNSPFYKYTPVIGTPMYEEYEDIIETPASLEEWGNMSWEKVSGQVFPEYLKQEKLYKSLFMTTLLLDKKVEDYSKSKLLRIISFFYRPIAAFRLKHLFFKFNIELFFFERIFKLF